MRTRRAGPKPLGLTLISIAPLLACLIWGDDALGRGGGRGLRWGYRPPAGDPLMNNWLFANPWAAMGGAGIPRRNLGPSNLNMGGPPGGRSGSGGSLPGRSTIFPGSASQPSRSTAWRPRGGGFSASTFSAPSRTPEPADDFLNPPYYHDVNDDWHHGYWGGGLWGWSAWDSQWGAWSFPRWRVGPWFYTSGYGRYVNPFVEGDARLKPYETVIEIEFDDQVERRAAGEKSQPETPVDRTPEKPSEATERLDEAAGRKAFEVARAAFRSRDYALALLKTDEALQNLLHDPAVHEFRGLVLFALGDFRQAAAVIYDVLAVSPGWDWTTLSSLYADSDEYTRQLRALENYRRDNPEVPGAAFMVAYHYATCGHYAVAVRHLRNVVRLLPEDMLSPNLLTLLADAADKLAAGGAPAATNAGGADQQEQAASIEASTLHGAWKCSPAPDVRIELTLSDGGQFTWTVDEEGHQERFHGEYRVGRNLLLLACDEGTLIGVLTVRSLGGGFNFRVLENAPQGAGLDFDK